MATLTVQNLTEAANGITPSYASASTADDFDNDGMTWLHVKNSGTQKTLTVTSAATSLSKQGMGNVALSNIAHTIPATTGDKLIGPFPTGRYNNSSGRVAYTLDSATGVTVAAIRMPRYE